MRNIPLALLVIAFLAAFIYASFWLSENFTPELLTLTPEKVINTTPYMRFRFTTTPEVPTRIPESTAVPEKTPVLVRVESVNVHSSPSLHAPVIGWLFQNDTVVPEFCDGDWAHINGTGWVKGTCLSPNPCGEKGSCK